MLTFYRVLAFIVKGLTTYYDHLRKFFICFVDFLMAKQVQVLQGTNTSYTALLQCIDGYFVYLTIYLLL